MSQSNTAGTTPLDGIRNIPNVRVMEMQDDILKIISNVDVIFEDGMRISELVYRHQDKCELKKCIYSIEQTTNGIRSFENIPEHEFLYPVFNVAESEIKLEVENSMATPESILARLVVDGHCALSQKNILVIGYGSIGRGMSAACRAHGANVTVVEANSIKRVLASSHGYVARTLSDLDDSIREQDIIISCTSNRAGSCLGPEQIMLAKDRAKIVNAGSGIGEVSSDALKPESYEQNRATASITKNDDGNVVCVLEKMGMKKTVEVICSANPLNLGCGLGTPDEIIDFVFSLVLVILVNADRSSAANAINPIDPSWERQVTDAWLPDPYGVKTNHIKHEDLAREYRPWGNLTRFFSHESCANLSRFSMVRASFERNTRTDGHYHAVSEEAYFVESGSANISTWDPKRPDATHKTFRLNPGDYLSIPKSHAHRVFVGPKEAFVCLVIASPPFSFWDQFFPARQPSRHDMMGS